MSALQLSGLIVVAVVGGAVVFTGEALRQTMVLAIYGMSLTYLFFTFQAPDVALSEIVVSTIGLPLIILAALRKIRELEREHAQGDEEGR